VGRIALNGTDVESIMEFREQVGPYIDHDNIVVLPSQAGEQAAPHLPCPKDDDPHKVLP
jgi:hypothetical protein